MRRRAEHMIRYSGLPTFGVIALGPLNIAISTMYLCPPCNLKIVQDIIMNLLTNVKHYKTMCRTQKTVTLVNLLLELRPFEQRIC